MNSGRTELGRRVVSRVTRRLIPLVFLCYVVAYIDRVNISFVNDLLQKRLGMSNEEYGLGAGLFFIGYFLFEIPSNLILDRVGARIWIARIMIVWGIMSMATICVVGKWSFYSMRLLLGLAEAGFFPGMVLYLTYWIPARERARSGALFMMAAPVAMFVGPPIWWLVQNLHGRAGLEAWQWLFLVEGFPAVLLGVITLFCLTDAPGKAAWLTAESREWLSQEMARERAHRAAQQQGGIARSLFSGKMWLLCIVYFLNTTVTYGIFFWLPKMLKDASGYKDKDPRLLLITMIPFAFALVGMFFIGRHSDRTGERKGHVAVCAIVASIGLALAAAFQKNLPLFVASFALCQIGQRSVLAPFWAIPPIFLGGTAAAAGIALINSLGNLGGQAGTWVMGWLRDLTRGYSGGLLVLAGALIVEAALVLSIRLPRRDLGAPPAPEPDAAKEGARG